MEKIVSQESKLLLKRKKILLGCRIPRDFFVTSGKGESDITIHAGSFHLALREAGIERYNIINYSSILPSIANRIEQPSEQVHGAVLESIMACTNAKRGEKATASIIFGWLFDRVTGERHGGLVCEYNGHDSKEKAESSLKKSIMELYTNGFSEGFDLKNVEIHTESFKPRKKFGTALVSICFVNHEYPVLES
jgi:arginine decarboxylase